MAAKKNADAQKFTFNGNYPLDGDGEVLPITCLGCKFTHGEATEVTGADNIERLSNNKAFKKA